MLLTKQGWCCCSLVASLFFVSRPTVSGVETIKFGTGDQEQIASGEILVEAQDGGVMLQADDGQIWTLQPEAIIARKSDERPFQPISPEEMQVRLKNELGSGFEVFRTQHYVIGYNSSEAYAKQVVALFEQLYRSFFVFWKNQRWDQAEPKYPWSQWSCVTMILSSYATRDIGDTAKPVIGYYHLGSNRMITFNVLTGNVTLPPSFMKQLTSLPTTAACSVALLTTPCGSVKDWRCFLKPLIAGIPEIGAGLEVSSESEKMVQPTPVGRRFTGFLAVG